MPKTVLVTRPAHQAESLIQALEQAGYQPIACPMLAIETLPETGAMRQLMMDLDLYDQVIVTSANAARPALAMLDRYWPQWPVKQRWLAVGTATAEVLIEAGLDPLVPPAGSSSEALLELPELLSVEGQRILILKGVGGRTLLADALTNAGARVDSVSLYQRQQLSYSSAELQKLFETGPPDILLATSESVLHGIEQNLQTFVPQLHSLPLIAFSQRIAGKAGELGYRQVMVAEDVSDRSILSALNALS